MPQIKQKVNIILTKKEPVFSEKTGSFLSLAI
jgi:hypothetical protein